MVGAAFETASNDLFNTATMCAGCFLAETIDGAACREAELALASKKFKWT